MCLTYWKWIDASFWNSIRSKYKYKLTLKGLETILASISSLFWSTDVLLKSVRTIFFLNLNLFFNPRRQIQFHGQNFYVMQNCLMTSSMSKMTKTWNGNKKMKAEIKYLIRVLFLTPNRHLNLTKHRKMTKNVLTWQNGVPLLLLWIIQYFKT